MYNDYDYRYSDEATEYDLKIIWTCDKCGASREDYPGVNEGGKCYCGGFFEETGESHKG